MACSGTATLAGKVCVHVRVEASRIMNIYLQTRRRSFRHSCTWLSGTKGNGESTLARWPRQGVAGLITAWPARPVRVQMEAVIADPLTASQQMAQRLETTYVRANESPPSCSAPRDPTHALPTRPGPVAAGHAGAMAEIVSASILLPLGLRLVRAITICGLARVISP